MISYAGPREGDERPEHAGKYIDKGHLGHEAFNFFDFDGTLFGTFGIIANQINLWNIDPELSRDAKAVDGVLVVFFAPDEDKQQRIVGWYRDAKVYRRANPYPPEVKSRIRQQLDAEVKRRLQQGLGSEAISEARFDSYWSEADLSGAFLLPVPMRKRAPTIPRGLGGAGQCNVCYAYKDGALKPAPWIQKAIDFITDYSGPNLLTTEAEAEADAFTVQERAAGFPSDPKRRKVIEQYAMGEAIKELDNLGFGKFSNTSRRKCYDYTCEKDGTLYYVEVKGTQGSGKSVILTKNEVEHWSQYKQNSIAVILHHVQVDPDGRSFQARGGTAQVCLPWNIEPEALETIQYKWTVPESPKVPA